MKARCDWIDNLKAIGIVLVVLGHAPGIPPAAHTLIFGAHVPLFFFASGYLAGRRPGEPLAAAAHTAARRLLLPYLGFFLLSYLYWLPTHAYGNSADRYAALPWWDPLYDLAAGQGGYVNPTLWFLPCLALAILAHRLARELAGERTVLAASLGGAILAAALWPRALAPLPWQADTALVAVGFYALGHYGAQRPALDLDARASAALRPWALALLALYAAAALANPGVDYGDMRFGATPALAVPVAVLGIGALALAAASFAPNRVTRWLSANTLFIFPLHWLMFRVFTGIGVVLFALPRDFKNQSWSIGLLYTVLALAAWAALAALWKRLPRRGANAESS